MKTQPKSSWQSPLTWLRILILIILITGIFFRFYNIDKKVYWNDESLTSLLIFGYSEKELVQNLFNGHIISIDDLHKYQKPNLEKSIVDTIKSLAVEDAQHPPLYYLMVRFWVHLFGASVAVTRSLSAFISLLVFPCIYWLCQELFKSPLIGGVAMVLIAVSPFHVLYAQEAREYSLWTVTILLSSAVLLRAMRLKTKVNWRIYAVTVALGLYTHLFFVFVVIGHSLYVATQVKFQLNKITFNYIVYSLVGILIFVPWLILISIYKMDAAGWTAQAIPLFSLVQIWLNNLSSLFIDLAISNDLPLIYLSIPILILVGYSIYIVCRQTPKQIWLFILTLTLVTSMVLMLPDIILGGVRSSMARYLIPSYLGIQLAMAYLLTTKITSTTASVRQQKLWSITAIILIISGILSCAISSQADTWWTKVGNYSTPPIARVINKATQPLVISDTISTNVLSLSHLLHPKVRLQLVVKPNIPTIPDGFSDLFLFRPSKNMRTELEKNYKLVPYRKTLYKLERKNN